MLPNTCKYALIIDSLTLTLESNETKKYNNKLIEAYPMVGNQFKISENVYLLPTPEKVEKYYDFTYSLLVHGKNVGTLSTNGRAFGQSDMVSFRFNNWVFYVQGGWYPYYQILANHLNLFAKSINYIEIACDQNNDLLERFTEVYRFSNLLEYNADKRYRHVLSRMTLGVLDNGREFVFGKARGSNATGKAIAFYNKSDEIEANNKPYISDFHKLNGLDIVNIIERVEARLTHKWLRDKAITVHDLIDQSTLESLYREALTDVFSFFDATTMVYDKNRNKKSEIVNLYPVDFLSNKTINRVQNYDEKLSSDQANRIVLKRLTLDWLATGNASTAAAICEFTGFHPVPENSNYLNLLQRYAGTYSHKMTVEVEERIASVYKLQDPKSSIFVTQTPDINEV